jgi:hypothetical protein
LEPSPRDKELPPHGLRVHVHDFRDVCDRLTSDLSQYEQGAFFIGN